MTGGPTAPDRSPDRAAARPPGPSGRPLRVAYVMSRFPKLTETFILFEILAVEELGARVELFPLLREREARVHPEALPLVERAHYLPFLSPAILASQLHHLRRRPRRYLGALAAMLRGTWGSRNFFLGGLGIFAKVAHAARLMSELGVDHVHCHFASHPALAGFLVHRLTGIPYSFTAHGSDLHVDRTMLGRKVAEAAFTIAISNDNAAEIAAETAPPDRARIEVLHCGVDTRLIRPAERAADGGLRILSIGTLHEVKGQVHLVDAVARLAAAGRDVSCRFVGDGPDRAMLEARIAAAGLAGRVTLVGPLARADVLAELARADVLVAPSVPTREGKREGIPIVLMEGMAAGLPVVASRLSGIPELVEDERSGLLVAPGDPAALAGALERLAVDPALRARLGASARERVVRDFDVRANAAALLDRIEAVRRTRPALAGAPLADAAPGGAT